MYPLFVWEPWLLLYGVTVVEYELYCTLCHEPSADIEHEADQSKHATIVLRPQAELAQKSYAERENDVRHAPSFGISDRSVKPWSWEAEI
jgi:hypothetical protein